MKLFTSLKLAAALTLAVSLMAGCENKQADPRGAQAFEVSPGGASDARSGQPQGSEDRRMEIVYGFSLTAPVREIAQLQQKHLGECRRLGCEVLSTSLNRSMKDAVLAQASIRIAPAAFPEFEQILSAPPSEIGYRSETATDRTLPLLDAEKRLEVKTALRDRLTAMLRDPGQKSAADVAAIERQIAEVQGEIEAGAAQRDYLRKVTQTVRVDISYRSVSARAGGIDFSPAADALGNAGRIFSHSLGQLISVAVWLIPWLPVAALVYWGARRLRRRGWQE